MLVNLNDILPKARKYHYAVPAFNIYNLEVFQGIFAAASTFRSPLILAISEKALKYAGNDFISQYLVKVGESSQLPIVIHLDHAQDISLIKIAIDLGFTSVMIDASEYRYEKNLDLTQSVVALAHRHQVTVEAELGTIGGQEDYIRGKEIQLANPLKVAEFVEKTQIDALAVALGTSHGLPVENEKVDLERLDQIALEVNIPLVLHGASNLPANTLRAAIKRGIAKINIDTELRQAFTLAVRESLRDQDLYDPREYLASGREKVEQEARKIIKILGTENKA